ncbi:hypothetical protein GEMRC1_002793 [Eukaryota sp. GEM-RC1]
MVRSRHPVYDLLVLNPDEPKINGKDNVACIACEKSMIGSAHRFVGHFIPQLTGRGVSSCKMLSILPQTKLNSVRVKEGFPRLIDCEPNAVPDNQPRIDDLYSDLNLFKDRCDVALVDMLSSCGIAPNVVNNPEFQKFCEILSDSKYKLPCDKTLRETMIPEKKLLLQSQMSGFLTDLNKNGCSLVFDGWSDIERKPYLNFLLVNFRVKKDSQFIAHEFIKIMQEVGPQKITQIISDNAPVCPKAVELVQMEYNHVIYSPCSSHTLDLIMKGCKDIEPIGVLVNNVRRLITFVINKGAFRETFEERSPLKLLKPAVTRFYTNFIVFERLLLVKPHLVSTFMSDEVTDAMRRLNVHMREEGVSFKKMVIDLEDEFWPKVVELTNFWRPIVELIRFTDRDGGTISKMLSKTRHLVTKSFIFVLLDMKAFHSFPRHKIST